MLSEQDVATYRRDGVIVVPDVLDAATVGDLRRVVAEVIAGAANVTQHDDVYDLEPSHTPAMPRVRRIKSPHKVHPLFDEIVRSQPVIDILTHLIGPGLRLHGSKLNIKAAQYGSPVEWHQDWAFYPHTNDDILAIAPEILRVNPNVRFVFVGDGVLRDRLKAETERLGVSHAFRFTGLVPPDRIPELLHGIDAVIHPSLREGLARVLPQALLVGRPVISYDIDGAKEVVRPETGFLVPPKDLAGLRQAVLTLAGNAELRASLGDEGRRRFAEQFRKETMTDQLRLLYDRLLADAKRRG